MAQMIDMAIMTIQVTSLYSQALVTEWKALSPITKTWDMLENHFVVTYSLCLILGTTTAGHAGYHSTTNIINNDNTFNNIEQMLNHKLSNQQVSNNAKYQSTQQMLPHSPNSLPHSSSK